MIHYKVKKYSNGLTLITAPLRDTQAVTSLVLVRVGSRYENKENNGISHFLEHLFFKGTKKRPSTFKISQELDGMGAKYNAFTSEESTGFYVQIAGEKFAQGWDILSDMLLNPLLPEKEIKRERGVIIEEMKMYWDMPARYVHDLAKRQVYGDTPLGREIIGTKNVIEKLNRADILNYRTKYYSPQNIIVIIAGKGNEVEWEKTVAKSFSHDKKADSRSSFEKAQINFSGPTATCNYKKTDQAHLVVNIPTFPSTDKRWPVLEVLTNILGGQMSSRLFIEIRERRGLAYYVRATADSFYDSGLLSVSAGLRTSHVKEALAVIKKQFEKLVKEKVQKEELTRARENIIGHLAMEMEGSFNTASFLADQYFYKKNIKQPEKLMEQYRKVTAQDVQLLAHDLFKSGNIAVTTLGPLEKKQEDKLVSIFNK
ncbi:insulinase family protein [Patescibacteria group bacterium]|nr:insulinase family protein [Patescibacteria group bacterium]